MDHVYRSYYTKSDPIVKFMIDRLSVKDGLRIFEPCAGDGVFIDALNSKISDLSIDIFELNPDAFSQLKQKYGSSEKIEISLKDTISDLELKLLAKSGGVYDRIIANPPYGGWLDYDKRRELKKLYPGLYVKETYTLFLYRCTQLLRNGGLLVFIVPDTFLNLHMHTNLRAYLLRQTKIKEICLFPSAFFPGVNFGYSNLCIITLQKSSKIEENLENNIKVITGFKNVEELADIDIGTKKNQLSFKFRQSDVLNNVDHALFVSRNPKITHLINNCKKRVGDIANCVTGFYSGNDKQYLRPASDEVRNAKKYQVVDKDIISSNYLSNKNILEGINGRKCYIPIVKGGGVKFYKPDLWYMDWSKKAVKHYKSDKRARFQNSQFYFASGIGVPMVSSSSITGALIERRLFDQSIVGIFPHDEKWLHYLLAFFNSPTCNNLIRTINPSTNNPANYVKKIPFIAPTKARLAKIDTITKKIIRSLKTSAKYSVEDEDELHNLINEIYKL